MFDAGVHFTPQQNVLLTGIPDGRRSALEAVLAHHGVRSTGAISTVRRWSMACPALPTCGLALAESERVLPGVIDELERELARLGLADLRLTVRMTGCPNGCARPYTADLAFVGRSLHKYGLFVGGSMLARGWGRSMPISFRATGPSLPCGRCSSATAPSGSTTSASATSAIGC